MADEKLLAREGDVLVVSYPEVKIQVAPYSTVGVGSNLYTRKLIDGDDVQEQYDRVYNWLKSASEKSAREKVQLWSAELERKSEPKAVARPPAIPAPAGKPVSR